MQHWILLAQDITARLRNRCEHMNDLDLKREIDQVLELIKQAEMEFGDELKEDGQVNGWNIIGQCGNVSKIFTADEISYCQSDDKKVFIFDTNYRCYRTNSSLKEIESRLNVLIKLNQSTLVNQHEIKCLEHLEDFNHYLVRIKSGKTFRVSRRCTKKVKDLFSGDPRDKLVS